MIEDLIPEGTIEFDGPPTSHCLGKRYITLKLYGIDVEGSSGSGIEFAREGEAFKPRLCPYMSDKDAAVEAFREAFHTFIMNGVEMPKEPRSWHAMQIAWRRRPSVEELRDEKGNFVGWLPSARLAVWYYDPANPKSGWW